MKNMRRQWSAPTNARKGIGPRGWRRTAVLLAAATLVPVGLAAQEPAPAPESASWLGQTIQDRTGQARRGMSEMFEMDSAESGWLGVSVEDVSNERAREQKLPRAEGVYVAEVDPDSPAAKAGIKSGEVIIGYNGQTVEGVLQFRRLVRETPPGRSVSLRVWRSGAAETLSAEVSGENRLLESRMPNAGALRTGPMEGMLEGMGPRGMSMFRAFAPHPMLGVNVEDVEGQLGQYFQVPGGRGVLAISVNADSPAAKAGIKAGDVIYQIGAKPVHSVEQLEEALRAACSSNGVSVSVVRKGATLVERAQIQCPQPPGDSSSTTTMR